MELVDLKFSYCNAKCAITRAAEAFRSAGLQGISAVQLEFENCLSFGGYTVFTPLRLSMEKHFSV